MNPSGLPDWARRLVTLYESGAATQFLLFGNVHDRFFFGDGSASRMGDLKDFLLQALLPGFDVVLSYDLGNGLRVEKGAPVFSEWPSRPASGSLPRPPLTAIELASHYFRYCANLAAVKAPGLSVGCLVQNVELIAPSLGGGYSYEPAAIASQIRNWTTESVFVDFPFASFLITDNLSDVSPLLAANPRAARLEIPLPTAEEVERTFGLWRKTFPVSLGGFGDGLAAPAAQLAGASLRSLESLLRTREHEKQPLGDKDLAAHKKALVEKDCNGLIEFLEPRRTLADLYGLEKVKDWLRQDLTLWKKNDVQALPKGYLLCGPVGTGKTFLVECLAGEAGVPVVKLKNFRDKWVGSSEGNLERIFRLLQALGRCYVFVDEADQALGKRDSGSGDSGLSGRIYSMLAEEMSKSENRGRVIWILASSRPDLIEVDLKRPGRVDVKIPLFPAISPEESWSLLTKLMARRSLDLPADALAGLRAKVPGLLTPGTAEAVAVKAYRLVKTENKTPVQALSACLQDFQDPIPRDTMDFQIRLAVNEASDLSFVPQAILKAYRP